MPFHRASTRTRSFHSEPASEDHDEAQCARMYMQQAQALDIMPSMLTMLTMLRSAAHHRYRIKVWKLTDQQAMTLAFNVSSPFGSSPSLLHEGMRAGKVRMLGARIVVRD